MEFTQFYCCMDLIAATRAEGGLVCHVNYLDPGYLHSEPYSESMFLNEQSRYGLLAIGLEIN